MATALTKHEETLFRYLEASRGHTISHENIKLAVALKTADLNINARNNQNQTPLQLALRYNVHPDIILQILERDETDVNLPTYTMKKELYVYHGHGKKRVVDNKHEVENVPFLQAIEYTRNNIKHKLETLKVPLAVINHGMFDIQNDDLFASLKKQMHNANIKRIIETLITLDEAITSEHGEYVNEIQVGTNFLIIIQIIVLLWCYLSREKIDIDLNTVINGKSLITFCLAYKLSSFVKFLLTNSDLGVNVNRWDVVDQNEYILRDIFPQHRDVEDLLDLGALCPLIFASYYDEEAVAHLILKHQSFDCNTLYDVDVQTRSSMYNDNVIEQGDPLLIGIMKCLKSKKSDSLVKIVKHVTELPLLNANQTDSEGKTALMHAAMYNDHEAYSILLKHPKIDINVKDKEGNTCLSILSAEHKYSNMYLSYKSGKRNEYDKPSDLLLQILLKRADLAQEDITGKSAVLEALYNQNYDTAAILIDHPRINLNDAFQAYKRPMNLTEFIIYSYRPQKPMYEISPMQCRDTRPSDIVTFLTKLIQHKNYAKTITPTKAANGQTLLHFLIMENHFGEFITFLESRKDTNLQLQMDKLDASGVDIWEALFLCYKSTVKVQQSKCTFCEEKPSTQKNSIHKTKPITQNKCKTKCLRIKSEILQVIERLLRLSSIDVNKVFDKPYYGTLLHRAISHKIPEIVDIIINSERVNLSISAVTFDTEPQSMTPISLIMKLYKPLVDTNVPSAKEKPFYFLQPVKMITGKHSVEAILLAMVTSHPRLMEDINPIKTQDGLAVLHVLIKESKFKAIVELLQNRIESKYKAIEPFIEDSKGISIWEAMCISHQLHSQYTPDSKEQEHQINCLIESIEQAMEKLAIQDNTDINQKNQQGKTMFHFICIYAVNTLAIRFLKMEHADINIQDHDDYTPFMYGVGKLRVDVIEEYLNHSKCKIDKKNRYKQTIQTISDSMEASELDPRVKSLITAAFSKAKENEASPTQMLSESGIPQQLLLLKKTVDKDSKLSPGEKKRFQIQVEGMEKDYALSGSSPESQHSMSELHTKRLLRKRVYLCDEMTPRDVFDYLIEDGVLRDDDVEKIKLEGTRRGMCQALVSLLPRCGDKAYSSLIRALTESCQSHVAQELENYNPDEPQQPAQDAAGQALQVIGETGVAMAGQGVLMPVQVTSEGFLALPFYRLNTNAQ